MLRKISCCVIALSLAGCAGPNTLAPGVTGDEVASEKHQQQIFQLQNHFAQAGRLENVAFRLEVANREDCLSAISSRIGISALAASDVPAAGRQITVEALRLDPQRLTVVHVVDGSPAAKAGLTTGDVIVAINDEPAPASETRAWLGNQMTTASGRSARVEVLRQGQSRTLSVAPVVACSIPILLANNNEANAFTDGKRIVVHSAIMRIAQTDAQLAVIVGHELAHVTMAHLQKQQQNQAAGAVAGAAADVALALLRVNSGGAFTRAGGQAGAIAYAQEFEKEADYVGAYYAAKAGYDVAGVEQVWRLLAQENPRSMSYAGLHPTTPERFVQMQKTVIEIGEKQRRKVALRPEQKPQPVQVVTEREIGAQ